VQLGPLPPSLAQAAPWDAAADAAAEQSDAMEGAHGAGPSSAAPPPPPAVPRGGQPAAACDGGGSFFRRLPTELLPRVLDRVDQQGLGRLRLCERFTRDAVDARGWRQLTVRRLSPSPPLQRARAAALSIPA